MVPGYLGSQSLASSPDGENVALRRSTRVSPSKGGKLFWKMLFWSLGNLFFFGCVLPDFERYLQYLGGDGILQYSGDTSHFTWCLQHSGSNISQFAWSLRQNDVCHIMGPTSLMLADFGLRWELSPEGISLQNFGFGFSQASAGAHSARWSR